MVTTDKIKLKIKFAAIQCTCCKAATAHYRLSYLYYYFEVPPEKKRYYHGISWYDQNMQ